MRKLGSLIVACLLSLSLLQEALTARAYAAEEQSAKASEKGKEEGGKAKGNKEEKKKKGAEDISGGKSVNGPIYVHVAPLVLPVINERGVEQLVTIILDVQVKDSDAATLMQMNMPRIMDSLLRHLYGGMGEGSLRNGKLANVAKIKNKSVIAVGEVIGLENVRDVLIQGIAQRVL